MTSRNIRSGWSKTGLYPSSPAKVLGNMQEVPASSTSAPEIRDVPLQLLLSPTSLKTPTNTVSLAVLQRKLEERLERVTSTDQYVEKVLHVVQQAFAEHELLREENKTLFRQNNKKRTQKHIKERKIGDAKVMSFNDIVEARKLYDLAQAEKERKKAEKDKKKVEKEKKQVEKEREKEEKKRKKTEKDNDKARKEREKALKKTGVDRPKVDKPKTARTKCHVTLNEEAEVGLRELESTGLSAYCSILSFERTA
jgi:hypothetical protein